MIDNRMFERRVRELAAEASSRTAPGGAWEKIAARIRAGEVVVLPTETSVASSGGVGRGVKTAAILLFSAGFAVAALSTYTVQEWLSSIVPGKSPTALTSGPAPKAIEPAAAALPSTILVLDAHNRGMEVSFVAPAAGARVHVRFADVEQVQVQVSGAATNTAFSSGLGTLTITAAPAEGRLLLTIPRSLRHFKVEVDGATYLLKDEKQLRVLAPRADTAGPEIVLPIASDH